jgi:2-keto-4-pentenoate hydratase/2-oxohepta-3-ene-1,7-dioic acid hydratase in catechol pathway
MKVGRYFRGRETRPFFLDAKSRILDWSALDCKQVAARVRGRAQVALRSATDADFLSALPEIEEWLADNPGCLLETNHASELPAETLNRPMPPPVRPRNLICVGLNYRDHASESKMDLPVHPLLFSKTCNAIGGHNHIICIPDSCQELDFEAELAVVMGSTCRSVRAADAMSFVAGFTCINDISARDFQFSDGQWFRGKSCDGFAPLGPWLVTRDEIPDHRSLHIRCLLNGQVMQDSTTGNLVFDVPALIEFISTFITLEPGDVIATGTPPGVGFARKPPVYLRHGDRVEVEIERVGLLGNAVRRGAGERGTK